MEVLILMEKGSTNFADDIVLISNILGEITLRTAADYTESWPENYDKTKMMINLVPSEEIIIEDIAIEIVEKSILTF